MSDYRQLWSNFSNYLITSIIMGKSAIYFVAICAKSLWLHSRQVFAGCQDVNYRNDDSGNCLKPPVFAPQKKR